MYQFCLFLSAGNFSFSVTDHKLLSVCDSIAYQRQCGIFFFHVNSSEAAILGIKLSLAGNQEFQALCY